MFELGYTLNRESVFNTKAGSQEYLRMAEYANRMGYVIEERYVNIPMEDGTAQQELCFVIAEPDKPEEPTKVEQLEQEMAQCKQFLADTDYMATKCYELGLNMAQEYPTEQKKRAEARRRINEIEAELAGMKE